MEFKLGSAYDLPFPENRFDRVFSHALMEHLSDPVAALREAYRILKPGGVIGICSPDADGWLLSPPSTEISKAISVYADLQASNGGNLRVGKSFGILLSEAGFSEVHLSARYECYPSLEFIGEYLSLQLEQKERIKEAKTLLDWSKSEGGMFAQAWVSAVGTKKGEA